MKCTQRITKEQLNYQTKTIEAVHVCPFVDDKKYPNVQPELPRKFMGPGANEEFGAIYITE